MSTFDRYKNRYDLGTFNKGTSYVGATWMPMVLRRLLSLNPDINFLGYLHDNAYYIQDNCAKIIDRQFRDSIIEKTGEVEIANFLYRMLRIFYFISWYSIKLKKFFRRI